MRMPLRVIFLSAGLILSTATAFATVHDHRGEIEGDWIDEGSGNIEGLVDNVVYQGTSVAAKDLIARATYQIELTLPEAPNLYRPQCTGTLIAKDIVLSAAHCLPVRKGINLYVKIGKQHLKVVQIKPHPDFSSTHIDGRDINHNDLVLLRLARAVPNAIPALLPRADLGLARGQKVIVAGFGQNGRTPPLQELLRIPEIKDLVDRKELIVPSTEKERALFTERLLTITSIQPLLQTEAAAELATDQRGDPAVAQMILTSDHSTCHGDSGGPSFVRQKNSRLVLLGVHSTGTNEFCEKRTDAFILTHQEYGYDVFLPDYVDWIQAALKKMSAIEL